MRESDFREFSQLLDGVCGLLSRGSYAPSSVNTALWFRSLGDQSLDDVRAAFDAHVRDPERGRFVPTPADVLAQIKALSCDDNRPGAGEAWAMVLEARHEICTIIWTPEMAQAWSVSRAVLDLGDEVGARMAFKETYVRLVDQARRDRLPVTWSVSEGHDPVERNRAIAEAVKMRRLDAAQFPSLPQPREAVALLCAPVTSIPEHARNALLSLREMLTAQSEPASQDLEAKSKTSLAKEESHQKFREFVSKKYPKDASNDLHSRINAIK